MSTFRILALLVAVLMLASPLHAETLIKGAKLVSADSNHGDLADVLIRNGKIVAIGNNVAANEGAQVIEAAGLQLSAGLFNANTELGLREVGAVASSVDSASSNTRITASLKVADAINPSSVLLPYNRAQGLSHALVTPASSAGLFAGTAAVIQLSDTNTLLKRDAALVVELGAAGKEIAGGSRAAAMAQLREAFEDARDYRANKGSFNAGNRRDYPLSRHDLEALWPVLEGSLPLMVFVDRAADIERVIAFAKAQRIKLILAGVAEGWRVAESIAKAKVPVVIDPINNLPSSYDTLGARLDNAKLLHDAGVTLVFTGMSWHNTHNAYLVRQSAGNAVANGLPYQVAIAAMTSNPAALFGLAKAGRLEVGAPANLVLWKGDPLEPATTVSGVWLAGEAQSLVNRSTRLRDRYFSRLRAAE